MFLYGDNRAGEAVLDEIEAEPPTRLPRFGPEFLPLSARPGGILREGP
jgi:hypothetical protein